MPGLCSAGFPLQSLLPLVKGVGASAPPGEEHAQADRLKDTSQGADGDGVDGTLLGDDLGDEL